MGGRFLRCAYNVIFQKGLETHTHTHTRGLRRGRGGKGFDSFNVTTSLNAGMSTHINL